MRLAVFCGASLPKKAKSEIQMWVDRAADESTELVYGGASIGVMGMVADAFLERSKAVVGVIPKGLQELEVAHTGNIELTVVETMHERKQLMYERCERVAVFPGGIGTLDEFFEIWTWKQLGFHARPIAICNIAGHFDHLKKHLESCIEWGMLSETCMKHVTWCTCLDDFEAYLKGK